MAIIKTDSMIKMTEQLKALWKKIISYTKSNWEINDYPICFWKKADATRQESFAELNPWFVQVIKWPSMIGHGETKQQAFEDLERNFISYKEKYRWVPRPGKKVPPILGDTIIFADTAQIDDFDEIASDFFPKILDMNYDSIIYLSDLSDLYDFGIDSDETLQKINTTYGLGLTELGDGNLVRILNLIKEKSIK